MTSNAIVYHSESNTPLLFNNEEEVEVAIHYPYAEVRIYKRRWIILSAFSMLGLIQGAIWNTWGPISTSAKMVFPSWNDATIALLSNWGNICYVLFLLPVVWVMDTKGLRSATLLASFLIFVGAGIRCFTLDVIIETWLIHVGHFINGIAGIVMFAGPPQVSAAWFPPEQRTTATGMIYILSIFGVAGSSLISPLIVPEFNSSASELEKQYLKEQVLRLLYLQFLFASVMFVWILIYFPARPPFPPSISASVVREDFLNGLKMAIRNKDIWLVAIAYGISISIYSCWITVLTISLEALGIDQTEAGRIGCYSLLGGCASSFITARLCDQLPKKSCARACSRLHYKYKQKKHMSWLMLFAETVAVVFIDLIGGKMKFCIVTGLIGSTVCFLWFTGICLQLLPATAFSLYASVILGGTFNGSLQPVFIELGAEVAYPIGEAIVGGFLTGIFNVIGTIFLLLFFIPNIGYIWMNWCLIGSTVLSVPILMFVREHYARSAIDHQPTAPCTVT